MLWLVVGVVLGVLAAQQVARTPAGRRAFAAVGGSTGEFVQTVADSYRAHRAERGPGG